jgi:hypothetical protein
MLIWDSELNRVLKILFGEGRSLSSNVALSWESHIFKGSTLASASRLTSQISKGRDFDPAIPRYRNPIGNEQMRERSYACTMLTFMPSKH